RGELWSRNPLGITRRQGKILRRAIFWPRRQTPGRAKNQSKQRVLPNFFQIFRWIFKQISTRVLKIFVTSGPLQHADKGAPTAGGRWARGRPQGTSPHTPGSRVWGHALRKRHQATGGGRRLGGSSGMGA